MATIAVKKQEPNQTTIFDLPLGRLAMWFLIASELAIFGGLIGVYIMFRFRHPEWGHAAAHTSTSMGTLNTFFLLTSSLTIVLAHDAASKGKLKVAVRNMLITLGFGFGFLIVKGIEYTTEISHGYTITAELFWSFYYTTTGLHALHVIAGMTAIFMVMLGVIKNKNLHRVEYVGLYWHLVDLVWILLFPLFYLAK